MDIEYDMSVEIADDQEIIAHLADIGLARDFYRALCNMRWERIEEIPEDERIINRLKGITPEIWSCTWRSAGAIIASIRSNHHSVYEDYMSFYCSGDEGYVSELVEKNFNRLGWKKHPWPNELI